MLKVTAISDLHGYEPELPGGDLLIIAGDLTAKDVPIHYVSFACWLSRQPYRKIIITAGNHDGWIAKNGIPSTDNIEYLNNSSTTFEGLKIWGSPNSLYFDRVNPRYAHFMGTEKELTEIYRNIPIGTDIIVSHGPAYKILDKTKYDDEEVGSQALRAAIAFHKPSLFISGHIHECPGVQYENIGNDLWTTCLNVSVMDVQYKPRPLTGINHFIIDAVDMSKRNKKEFILPIDSV